MKIFFKIVFFLVLAMSIFIAIILLAFGKYLLTVILAVFGFLFLSYIRYQSNHYTSPAPKHILKQISGQGFQLLESLYSLQKTKNKDTLIRRIQFINDTLYPSLLQYSKQGYYNDIVMLSIYNYKKMYPNRQLTENEYALLKSPNILSMNILQNEAKKRLKIDNQLKIR